MRHIVSICLFFIINSVHIGASDDISQLIEKRIPRLYTGSHDLPKSVINLSNFFQQIWPGYEGTSSDLFATPFKECIPFGMDVYQYLERQSNEAGFMVFETHRLVLPGFKKDLKADSISYATIITYLMRFLAGVSPLSHFDDYCPSLNKMTDSVAMGLRRDHIWINHAKSFEIIISLLSFRKKQMLTRLRDVLSVSTDDGFKEQLYNSIFKKCPLNVPVFYLNRASLGIRVLIDQILNHTPAISVKISKYHKMGDAFAFSPINYTMHDWLHYENMNNHRAFIDLLLYARFTAVQAFYMDQNKYTYFAKSCRCFIPRYLWVSKTLIDESTELYVKNYKKFYSLLKDFLVYCDHKYLQNTDPDDMIAAHQTNEYIRCLIALFLILHEYTLIPYTTDEIPQICEFLKHNFSQLNCFPEFKTLNLEYRDCGPNDPGYSRTIDTHYKEIKSHEKLLSLLSDYKPVETPDYRRKNKYTPEEYSALYETIKPECTFIINEFNKCMDCLCSNLKAYDRHLFYEKYLNNDP